MTKARRDMWDIVRRSLLPESSSIVVERCNESANLGEMSL